MGRKKKKKTKDEQNMPPLYLDLRMFIWLFLAGLLLLSPLMRGLFFEPDLVLAFIFTSCMSWLAVGDILLRKSRLKLNLFDAAVLAMVVAFALSTLGAVDIRGAVIEVLKYLSYALVFFAAAYLIRSRRDMQAIIALLYAAAVIVALTGLLAATGIFPFPGAFDGRVISSTFQYPNTLAAYLIAGFILGLGLWSSARTLFLHLFIPAGNFLLLLTVFNTFSRGTWLLIPFLLVLFILLLPRQELLKNIYLIFLATGISFLVSRSFVPAMAAADTRKGIYYLLLGLVLSFSGALFYELVTRLIERWAVDERARGMVVNIVLVFMIVNVGAYVYYAFTTLPALSGHVVPRRLLEYAQTARPGDISFESRRDMNATALRIFRDHPLLGTGGRGWASVYHKYQPLLFYSTEVHNHYYQVLVEAGIIGFFAFASLWFFFAATLYRLFPRPREDLEENEEERRRWTLVWTAGVAAIGLGVHSAMDFDLSLPAVAIFLWSLLAVVRGPLQELPGKGEGEKEPAPYEVGVPFWAAALCLVIMALLLFIPAYRFQQAGKWGAKGAQMLAAGDLYLADEYYMKAVRLDPLQATYRADLAQIYAVAGLNQQDQLLIDKAYHQVEKAAELKPYDPVISSTVINIYQLLGEKEKAIAKAEELLEMNPLNIANYELVVDLNYLYLLELLARSQLDQARIYGEKILAISSFLDENLARIAQRYPAGPIYWRGRKLAFTEHMVLRRAQAWILTGRAGIAEESLLELAKGKESAVKEEALVWLVAACYLEKGEEEVEGLLKEMLIPEEKSEGLKEEALRLVFLLQGKEVQDERGKDQ